MVTLELRGNNRRENAQRLRTPTGAERPSGRAQKVRDTQPRSFRIFPQTDLHARQWLTLEDEYRGDISPHQSVETDNRFEHEIWTALSGLTMRVYGEEKAPEILGKLREHWQNFTNVDNKDDIPPEQRMITHAYRVGKLAYQWSIRAGFEPKVADRIALGAFVHDVGKGQVKNPNADSPEEKYKYRGPLTSRSALTDDEYKLIGEHSNDGYNILKDSGFDEEIAAVAKNHHAPLTPDADISTYALIAMLADGSDVRTHDRTYKLAEPRIALAQDDRVEKQLARLEIKLGTDAFTRSYYHWVRAAEPQHSLAAA